jgi:hypothetical protein
MNADKFPIEGIPGPSNQVEELHTKVKNMINTLIDENFRNTDGEKTMIPVM